MRKRIFLSWISMLVFQQMMAQDSLRTKTLQEVVVTASRSEQAIIHTPRSVTVIDRQTLERSIYNSVSELLAVQEGMYSVGAGQTPGSNQSLFMRGANANQVVILVDGVRLTDPSTPNAAIDLAELSLTDVERIEIVRGSHSTVFGGAAIGGAVNIITKKNSAVGFHGTAAIQGATFGQQSGSLTEQLDLHYALKNGLYFSTSLFNQWVDGLNAAKDTVQTPGAFRTNDQDGFNKTDVFLKAGFKNTRWDGFLSYKKVNQHAEIDAGAYLDDDNSYVDFDRDIVNYRMAYSLSGQWKITALGSWSKSLRMNENDSSVINDDGSYDGAYFRGQYNGRLLTNELQVNFDAENYKAVVGVGQYAEKMFFDTYYYSTAFGGYESKVNYDSIDASTQTTYAFAQSSMKYNKFNLSVGTRFSYHSIFGGHWTFEVNPSFQLDNSMLVYASLSSAYNAPSLNQLYDPTQLGAFTTRGNKDLAAEQSVSVEAGVKKEFQSGSYATLSAYHTKVRNAIEYVYLWNKETEIPDLSFVDFLGDTYLNVSQQIVNGIELKAHAELSKRFSAGASVTWMDGKLVFNPDDIEEVQTGGNHVQLYSYGTFITEKSEHEKLVRRPRFTLMGEVQYRPTSKISLSAAYRYVGARDDSFYDYTLGPFGALGQSSVKSYNLVDVQASWRIATAWRVGLKVENLLNEDYQEILGFQTRGRSAYLKLTFTW